MARDGIPVKLMEVWFFQRTGRVSPVSVLTLVGSLYTSIGNVGVKYLVQIRENRRSEAHRKW